MLWNYDLKGHRVCNWSGGWGGRRAFGGHHYSDFEATRSESDPASVLRRQLWWHLDRNSPFTNAQDNGMATKVFSDEGPVRRRPDQALPDPYRLSPSLPFVFCFLKSESCKDNATLLEYNFLIVSLKAWPFRSNRMIIIFGSVSVGMTLWVTFLPWLSRSDFLGVALYEKIWRNDT